MALSKASDICTPTHWPPGWALAPLRSGPIRFPRTTLKVACWDSARPCCEFPEIRLRSAGNAPPTSHWVVFSTAAPITFGIEAPFGATPRKLPTRRCEPPPQTLMPVEKPPIESPRIMLPAWFASSRPVCGLTPGPATSATWTTASVPTADVFGAAPGWAQPSISTGPVTEGRRDSAVIVCGPAPGIAKAMMSGPPAALASRIAWRSEPGPLSAVLVTLNVAAPAGPAARAATAKASARRNEDEIEMDMTVSWGRTMSRLTWRRGSRGGIGSPGA